MSQLVWARVGREIQCKHLTDVLTKETVECIDRGLDGIGIVFGVCPCTAWLSIVADQLKQLTLRFSLFSAIENLTGIGADRRGRAKGIAQAH